MFKFFKKQKKDKDKDKDNKKDDCPMCKVSTEVINQLKDNQKKNDK